jgi:hypothetical protein
MVLLADNCSISFMRQRVKAFYAWSRLGIEELSMIRDDERLLALCKDVTGETDAQKLDDLIQELNHELDHEVAKKEQDTKRDAERRAS